MNIKFKISGREVASGNIGEAIQNEAFRKIKEQMAEKVGQLRCQEHGQAPKLEIEGDSLSNMKIRVRACCQLLQAEAINALNTKV